MEPIEDDQRQGHPRNDAPRHGPVHGQLLLTGYVVLVRERLQEPEHQVAEHEKCDHLQAGLVVLLRQATHGETLDEQRLQARKQDHECTVQEEEQVLGPFEDSRGAGYDTENAVRVKGEEADALQD